MASENRRTGISAHDYMFGDPNEAQEGAWVVPHWNQLTGVVYDADNCDMSAVPVDDAFRDMLR